MAHDAPEMHAELQAIARERLWIALGWLVALVVVTIAVLREPLPTVGLVTLIIAVPLKKAAVRYRALGKRKSELLDGSMGAVQTAPAARRPGLWYFTTAASVLVGIVPIWVLETWFGVPRKITVGYGIIAYVIGTTALKLPLHHFVVERILRPSLPMSSLAAAHGALSAVSELAPAAAFFVYIVPQLTWWQLVGFGVGAGAVEAIMLPFLANPLKGTSLEEHANDVFRRSTSNPAVQWLSVLERVWAMLLQVSTRGLVGLSVYSGNPVPACLATVGFGAVDGTAYYGHLRKWRFDSLPVLARVHLFLGVAASVMAILFLWWSGLVWLGAG